MEKIGSNRNRKNTFAKFSFLEQEFSKNEVELSRILQSLEQSSHAMLQSLQQVNINVHPQQKLLKDIEEIALFTLDLDNFIRSDIKYFAKFVGVINALRNYNQTYTSFAQSLETQIKQLGSPHMLSQLENAVNNLKNTIYNQIINVLALAGVFLDEFNIRRELKHLESELIKKHKEADEILNKAREVVEKVTVGTLYQHVSETLKKIEDEIPKLDSKIKKWGIIFIVYCLGIMILGLKYFSHSSFNFITFKISLCLPPFLYLLYLLNELKNKEKLREHYRHKELLARTFLALEETLKKYRTTLGDEISINFLQPLLFKLASSPESVKEEDLYEMIERLIKIGKDVKNLGGLK